MIFNVVLLLALISAFVSADTTTIRLVSSFVDDPLDLDSINYMLYDDYDAVGVYSDSAYDFQGVVTDAGFFQITTGGYVTNSTFLVIDDTNGAVSVSNSSKSGPFEIHDEILYYQGSASFYLNQVSEGYDLYWGSNDNSLLKTYTLLLNVSTADDEAVSNFIPSSASTTYSLTTTTSTTLTSATSSSTGGASVLTQSNLMILIATVFSLFL